MVTVISEAALLRSAQWALPASVIKGQSRTLASVKCSVFPLTCAKDRDTLSMSYAAV